MQRFTILCLATLSCASSDSSRTSLALPLTSRFSIPIIRSIRPSHLAIFRASRSLSMVATISHLHSFPESIHFHLEMRQFKGRSGMDNSPRTIRQNRLQEWTQQATAAWYTAPFPASSMGLRSPCLPNQNSQPHLHGRHHLRASHSVTNLPA